MNPVLQAKLADTSEKVVRMHERTAMREQRRGRLLIGVAVLCCVGSGIALAWSYTLERRLQAAEMRLSAVQQQNDTLGMQLNATDTRLIATSESLGQSVGLTQRQLELRAAELLQSEKAESARLEHAQSRVQAEARRQIGAVSGEVTSVKTEVVSVKTDVAQTKTVLQDALADLQTMKGDMGVQSGLIATNARQLALLRRKGDRNYYEFTLNKGESATPIGPVSLSLKKADARHSRYTLLVLADDKKIEKKDRNVNEPVQFYGGRDSALYEVVVNTIDKNQVTGYLAAPKTTSGAVNRGGAL